MSESNSFHAEFIRCLHNKPLSEPCTTSAALARAIGVHHNTVVKGLVDALADNYPTVERLTGRDWFTASAVEYVQAYPPSLPMLALYGAGFADFLAGFGLATEFSYLPEVARIDRLWIEAYFERDATALPADALARLAPEELFERRLKLHPAVRFGWFSNSAVTIWLRHRPPESVPTVLEIDGSPEGILLTRPRGTVEPIRIDEATCAFLTHIRDGATLGAAATTALEMNVDADVAKRLAELICAGALAAHETLLAGA